MVTECLLRAKPLYGSASLRRATGNQQTPEETNLNPTHLPKGSKLCDDGVP